MCMCMCPCMCACVRALKISRIFRAASRIALFCILFSHGLSPSEKIICKHPKNIASTAILGNSQTKYLHQYFNSLHARAPAFISQPGARLKDHIPCLLDSAPPRTSTPSYTQGQTTCQRLSDRLLIAPCLLANTKVQTQAPSKVSPKRLSSHPQVQDLGGLPEVSMRRVWRSTRGTSGRVGSSYSTLLPSWQQNDIVTGMWQTASLATFNLPPRKAPLSCGASQANQQCWQGCYHRSKL